MKKTAFRTLIHTFTLASVPVFTFAFVLVLFAALFIFSMALRLNPTNEISLSNRGRAYARLGDYDKAVADFEAAAEFAPGNELIRQNLERAKRREKGL